MGVGWSPQLAQCRNTESMGVVMEGGCGVRGLLKHACPVCLLMSSSLPPHRPQPTGLLCMGFLRRECWRGLLFPSLGDPLAQGLSLHLYDFCTGRGALYH